MRGRFSARWGFTLTELLVVVAVMAMLAALLMPTFAQGLEKARQTACLSNLQQLSKAQLLYIQNWDEHLPQWYYFQGFTWRRVPRYIFWTKFLQPYLRSEAVFTDPSFALPEGETVIGKKLADYSLLTWGEGGEGTAQLLYWRWPGAPLTLAEIPRPAETFNLMDGYTSTELTRCLVQRHRQSFMNAGFLDGHARWLTKDQAYAVVRDETGKYYFRHIAANRD